MALDFIILCFQVLDLVEKVYKLAKVLTNPKVQLELSTKFNEPFVNAKIFMDYFNQVRQSSPEYICIRICKRAW